MRKKFIILIACAVCLLLSLSAVSAIAMNEVDTVLSSNDDNVTVDTVSANENNIVYDNDEIISKSNTDNLSNEGEFIDVSEAYTLLNTFRTEDGVWQWNSDNTTKTVFNTNDTDQLNPLLRDADLEKTAKLRAQEIAQLFSHTRPDGSQCFTAFPEGYTAMGENIAYGQTTCQEVTEAWEETDEAYSGQGHRRNMLDSEFNCVGIAGYKLNGTIYWVQSFGYSDKIIDNVTADELYVNGSKIENGDGSKDNPFNNLKSALDIIESESTIYIAPGTYTGLNNTNLEINKPVNIMNWTSQNVIFNGENKNTIFNITNTVNIIGLTFKNANNSAVNGNRKANIINCTFIDNTGITGGGINSCVDVINTTFINNTATYGGGAYECENIVNSSFINNTAEHGAAMYGCLNVTNCVFTNNNLLNNGHISVQNVTKYYKGPERFIVNVTNDEGIPLTGKSIKILINGVEYNRTTNANGSASIPLNLYNGIYPVNVTVDNETVSATVEILSSIEANNLTKYYKNASQFIVTFKNVNGEPLENGSATFNINGVLYERNIVNGTAKLNINLGEGNYIITTSNLNLNENISSNIEVLSTIKGENITKYFKNGTQYYATFLDANGNPLSDGTATFNINGVFYERNIVNGTAKLNINLHPGTYIITSYHPTNNQTYSNEITVLPILIANDLTKKYGNSTPFEVYVINGTANHDFDDYKVELNNMIDYFSKINVTNVTDFDVNATLEKLSELNNLHSNLSELIPSLPSNTYYILQDMDDVYEAANLLETDIEGIDNETEPSYINLQITGLSETLSSLALNLDLITAASAPLSNANVTFNINGKFYNRITDENGTARLNINLMAGEYIITSQYDYAIISNKITISY